MRPHAWRRADARGLTSSVRITSPGAFKNPGPARHEAEGTPAGGDARMLDELSLAPPGPITRKTIGHEVDASARDGSILKTYEILRYFDHSGQFANLTF